jgi:hypothetical protein
MTSRLSAVTAFTSLLFFVACGGATDPPGDVPSSDPPPADGGRSDAAPPAPGRSDGGPCVDGETRGPSSSSGGCFFASNNVCGDYSPPFVCKGGTFTCPEGAVPASACWCWGMGNPSPATCTCTPTGWSCPDAGAPIPG